MIYDIVKNSKFYEIKEKEMIYDIVKKFKILRNQKFLFLSVYYEILFSLANGKVDLKILHKFAEFNSTILKYFRKFLKLV